MPYKVVGRTVYHKKGGKWRKKQTCRSPAAARAARRLLEGVHRGWKPTGKKRKKGRRRKKR